MKNILYLLFTGFTLSVNAQFHQLVVTAAQAGDYGGGALFLGNLDGTNFHSVYNFEDATGEYPAGRVDMNANGLLYGATKFGGLSDSCVIYSYDLVTNTYTLLHDFYATPSMGWWDHSGPVLFSDGNLYGTTTMGGANSAGSLYRYNPTNDQYTGIFYFDDASGKPAVCALNVVDNFVYGTTLGGGQHNRGTLFRMTPPEWWTYEVLHHFEDSTGNNAGEGSLLLGTDNKFYGAVQNTYGSPNRSGLFSFDLTTNEYKFMHRFGSIYDGHRPLNPLVQGPDNLVYGVCSQGGAISTGYGTLFSFNVEDSIFTLLHTFDGTTGKKPLAGLMMASNGMIYGTASEGGTHNGGVVFKYDIDNSMYSVVYEFDSISGSHPYGIIYEADFNNTVGISNEGNNVSDLTIQPNPASSSAIIKSEYPVTRVKLTDISGREYITIANKTATNKLKIDGLDALANGIYLLNIECGNLQQTRKLIVQN